MMGNRLWLGLALIALVIVAAIGLYLWRRGANKPECSCLFPNTGRYGVIVSGNCVPQDCTPPAGKER